MPKAKPPLSKREKLLAKARVLRAARAARRDEIMEMVVGGFERSAIAGKFQISLKTVGREVDHALDQRRLDGVDRHLRLQVERLNKALRTIDCALEFGDVGAVDPLLKVIEKLDRYHGLGAARRAGAEPSPKRLDSQASPLALTHERTENCA